MTVWVLVLPDLNIFVGSESQRKNQDFSGKTEGAEMGLKITGPDKTAREGIASGRIWSSAGEAGKWRASVQVQKP